MLRLRRPPEPPGFRAKVAEARKLVDEAVRAGNKPSFDDLWTEYKADFQRAQHLKCGFCEAKLSDTGHIEHYRPKAKVDALPDDPDRWGAEVHGTNIVRGRGKKE